MIVAFKFVSLCVIILLIDSSALAEVYTCQNESGLKVYTDRPCAGKKKPTSLPSNYGSENIELSYSDAKKYASWLNKKPACKFLDLTLPSNTKLYSASARPRPLNRQLNDSGLLAYQIDVFVNSPFDPVVLFLGTGKENIWNIKWRAGTSILAVVASGYSLTAVTGLPKDIPLIISTSENKGRCGYFTDVNKGTRSKVEKISNKLFNRSIDKVFIGKEGSVFVGDQAASYITSDHVTPDNFLDYSSPLWGVAGIDDALEKRIIRPATASDYIDWLHARVNAGTLDAIPNKNDTFMDPEVLKWRLESAYVVQGKFQIPGGLINKLAKTFYVLDGMPVPIPSNSRDHSIVCLFQTGTCKGRGAVDRGAGSAVMIKKNTLGNKPVSGKLHEIGSSINNIDSSQGR